MLERGQSLSLYFSAFSSSMSFLTPSYICLTASYSLSPSRALFEMSYTPPSLSECSPWIPRTCRFSFSQMSYSTPITVLFQSRATHVEILASAHLGQLDVDRSSNGGSEIRRAECKPSESLITRERNTRFDSLDLHIGGTVLIAN